MKLKKPPQEFQARYVLIVFRSDEHRVSLLKAVADAGMVPLLCETLDEAREAMASENIKAVICEDLLPTTVLNEILKQTQNRTKPLPMILTSRTGEWDEFLTALRQGAFDYLVLPPRRDEVKRVLGLALAESSRTDADGTKSGEAAVSEGNSPIHRIADHWGVRFSNAASVLSRPLIPRAQMRGTR